MKAGFLLIWQENVNAAEIKSAVFAGKTRVQQHQMVYAALQGKMGGELHALAIQTVPIEE